MYIQLKKLMADTVSLHKRFTYNAHGRFHFKFKSMTENGTDRSHFIILQLLSFISKNDKMYILQDLKYFEGSLFYSVSLSIHVVI